MKSDFEIRTADIPYEMQALLREYPRDSWEAHPGFKDKTRHWLVAHQMFRRLGGLVRSETERYLDRSRDPGDYAGRLSHHGGRCCQTNENSHQIAGAA